MNKSLKIQGTQRKEYLAGRIHTDLKRTAIG